MMQFTQSLRPRGILRFTGPDASKFLQGQTTCHLDELNTENALVGAFCNPKGRIKTTFLLVMVSDEELLMILSPDQCEYIKAELAPYIAFFKAEIEVATQQLSLFGVMDPDNYRSNDLQPRYPVTVSGSQVSVVLPDYRQIVICPLGTQLDAAKYHPAELDWDAMDIEMGMVWTDEERREKFLPHDVNLPGLGGVSYDKGCYTGQEIVARMHYRGNPKYTSVVLIANESDVSFDNPLKSKEKAIGQMISTPVSRGGQTLVLISANKDISDHLEIGLSNPVERAILCDIRKPNLR